MDFSRVNGIHSTFKQLGEVHGRLKETKVVAASKDGSVRLYCLISKDYEAEKSAPDGEKYWFTIYDRQLQDVLEVSKSYVSLGCGSSQQLVLFPADLFYKWTSDLSPYTQGKIGWHIVLRKEGNRWLLRRAGRGVKPLDVSQFAAVGMS